jgi:AAA domain
VAIINIQKLVREGARTLTILSGPSGSGKTLTALLMGLGMANEVPGKLGILDTENGRGKLYADDLPEGVLYAELKPPFSPDRYVQAINEYAKAGVEVLVIDSGSHEWEGLGGCEDIAKAGNPAMPNWNKAKTEHKKFMSAMLNSPMHIILCLRAREKAKPEKQIVDGREKTVYVDMGMQPITEKNVVFEATASLMMHDQGRRQDPLKVPAALQDILGRGQGYIGIAEGRAIRAWVDGAKQLDPKVEHSRGLLQLAAEKGMAALQAQWLALPKTHQKAIGGTKGCPADLKASAEAFDKAQAEASQGGEAEGFQSLNAAAKSLPPVERTQPAAAPASTPAESPDDDGQAGAQGGQPADDDGPSF